MMNELGTLAIPDVISFGDEDVMLDYDNIREITKEAKKKAILERKMVSKEPIPLTDEEKKKVAHWVKEIEKYVKQWAAQGNTKFIYDCSKIDLHVFVELGQSFKNANPRFYVETHLGKHTITITWDGKNEV